MENAIVALIAAVIGVIIIAYVSGVVGLVIGIAFILVALFILVRGFSGRSIR